MGLSQNISEYPGGFANGVSIQGMPILNSYGGKVFWVDSNGSGSGTTVGPRKGTFNQPFKTLDSAIGHCKANRGDIIMIKPGHTEVISSATALNFDVAGISIVGLGEGTLKPTFTLDTATTTTIPVSAANISISNVKFSANFADIVACFTLTTAKYFKIFNCEFVATAADMNFTRIIDTNTTDNAADGLTASGCRWVDVDLATETFVDVDADLDGLVFTNNYINIGVNTSDLPAIAVVATGKDLTNLLVRECEISRLNDANPLLITVDTTTANTGIIRDCRVRHLDTAGELLVTAGTNIGFFDNKATAAVDASGYLLPAADS